MRKLVSIRPIKEVIPIKDADRIQVAKIDGWSTIVSKEHKVGDLGVYFEIDSFLPIEERYSFLEKSIRTKTFVGNKGKHIKTKRFKGMLSQGLWMPLSEFPELTGNESGDISKQLNVLKYELEESTHPNALGNYPYFIPKTDQERVQNVFDTYVDQYKDIEFVPSIKLHGSSTTMYFLNDPNMFLNNKSEDHDTKGYEIGLCSRNLRIDPTVDSIYAKGTKLSNWETILTSYCKNTGRQLALQGETVGQGILGNTELFVKTTTLLFAVYDIDNQRYFTQAEYDKFVYDTGINHCPMLDPIKPFNMTLEEILEYANGESINGNIREGVVFKSTKDNFSFKSISNEWLLNVK